MRRRQETINHVCGKSGVRRESEACLNCEWCLRRTVDAYRGDGHEGFTRNGDVLALHKEHERALETARAEAYATARRELLGDIIRELGSMPPGVTGHEERMVKRAVDAVTRLRGEQAGEGSGG